jgi:PmbA protein
MHRAIENANIVSSSRQVSFTPVGLEYADDSPVGYEAPGMENMLASTALLESKARSLCQDARLAGCTLAYVEYADQVANSLGLSVKSCCRYFALNIHLLVEKNGSVGEKQMTLLGETADDFKLEEPIREALITARFQAAPEGVPSGKYDLIISRNAAYDFLFMLWRSMSAVQQRQSGAAFAGKEGQKIGDLCVTIVNAGDHRQCPIRYRIDNEGMPVVKTRLMVRGVFRSMMHNRSTAGEMGISSTGNAGRRVTMSGAIQVPLLVTPKILYIQAGNKSYDELLRLMGDGLVLVRVLDTFHGIDYASGEFSVPVMCLIVRGGRVCGATRSLVWSGNLKDVLNKTQAVGNRMHFDCFRHSYILGGPDMFVQNQILSSAI